MAKLISVDGTIKEIVPEDAKKGFQLKELYELIGTDIIELIHLPNNEIMIVDEEGTFKEPCIINEEATRLFGYYSIVGNVVVCKSSQFK